MKINNEINKLIEKLVATYLMKGVQPSEIADAVFDDPYTNIEISKSQDLIQMLVTFTDSEDKTTYIHRMRYTYSLDRKLLKVEQKIGSGRYKVQWDREESIQRQLQTLINSLKVLNAGDDVNELVSKLPRELRFGVKAKLKLVA